MVPLISAGGGEDTTPPAVPTGLTPTAGVGNVSLTWTHADPGDVANYNVRYRCPSGSGGYTIWSSPASPSALVTGLTAGTECDFSVNAEDAAGNPSAYTADVQSTPIEGSLVYTPNIVDTGTDHMYFNSSEIGCTRSGTVAADVVGCDDFQDGDWYRCGSGDVDANGGDFTTQDGWWGSVFTNYGGSGCQWTPSDGDGPKYYGAAVSGLADGLGGTQYAAKIGPYVGTDDHYGLHDFYPGGASYDDIWLRVYIRVSSDYDFGFRKVLSFNNEPAAQGPQIKIGGFGSGEGDGRMYICPTYDCTLDYWNPQRPDGYNGAYLRANLPTQAAAVDLDLDAPANKDQWVFLEVHIGMESAPGVQDGVYEYWSDLCGSGPEPTCSGIPTKRAYYDNVRWRNPGDTDGGLESVMFEAFANPGDVGTYQYWAFYRASTSGPIGFLVLPNE